MSDTIFKRVVRQASGFTLIELLIVVAIIAILAAIAVPNFLEAQTRSKVSRAKSDLRTFATALESYRVDNNTYCRHNTEQDNPQAGPTFNWRGFRQLTTPIGYIATIPLDSFGNSQANGSTPPWRPATYALGTGKASTRATSNSAGGWPADCYELDSDGPDKYDQTAGMGSAKGFNNSQWPWALMDKDNIDDPSSATDGFTGQPITARHIPYDPTNGTVSQGEILRFGGVKVDGAMYDYLWGASIQ